MPRILLALILVASAALGVFVAKQVQRDAPGVSDPEDSAPEFIRGHFVTFEKRRYAGPVNERIEGAPEGFALRVLSDNWGDRLRGLKFLLSTDGKEFDQVALAHSTGEDVLLSTDRGTLRVRVLGWDGYDNADATATGCHVQFDFMLPKD